MASQEVTVNPAQMLETLSLSCSNGAISNGACARPRSESMVSNSVRSPPSAQGRHTSKASVSKPTLLNPNSTSWIPGFAAGTDYIHDRVSRLYPNAHINVAIGVLTPDGRMAARLGTPTLHLLRHRIPPPIAMLRRHPPQIAMPDIPQPTHRVTRWMVMEVGPMAHAPAPSHQWLHRLYR
jgi:hypothetical protein